MRHRARCPRRSRAGATPWRAGPHAAGRPRCTAATAARRRRSRHDRPARPLALPDLALQREGALGARLEGHPARAPRARAELHAAALWATGQAKLPVLFLDGQAIADSTRIIEALERLQPEPALSPRDEAARRRALALEDFFDEEVGHAVRTAIVGPLFAHDPVSAGTVLTTGMGAGAQRAVHAVLPAFRAFYKLRHGIDDAAIAAAPARVRVGLDRIVAEVGPSGYLVGDAFSVAVLTAAALLSPIVLPPEFPYPPPGPRPRHLTALRASLEGHPAFRWVLETYRRHRGTSAAIAG